MGGYNYKQIIENLEFIKGSFLECEVCSSENCNSCDSAKTIDKAIEIIKRYEKEKKKC